MRPPSADRNPRLPGLDALRGVAALLVVFFHLEHIAFGTPEKQQIFRLGLLGVELFFMISGFVILMVAQRASSLGRFVGARIVRLYPAYLASVALTAIYVLIVGKYALSTVLVNATMLQSFLAVPNITNPYWTLAFEIVFYAFMTAVLAMRLTHRLEAICLVWLLVSLAYRLAFPAAMTLDESRPVAQLAFILLAPQFSPFFIIGMMIYRWQSEELGISGWAALAGALALTLLGRGDFAQIGGFVYFAFSVVSAGLLMVAARLTGGGAGLQVLAWIGMVSYPLYLLHCTVANLAVLVAPLIGAPVSVLVVASGGVSLALAAALHLLLERPAQRWFRLRFSPSSSVVLREASSL